MNRGFSYYFKKSKDLFSFVFRKQRGRGRMSFIIYMIASAIGKLFLFTRPIFLISDQNMANMVVNGHSFAVLKAFHGTKERYLKMLLAEAVEYAIYFAIIFTMVAPFALLFANQNFGYIIAPIALSVMGTAALITCFFVSFNYAFVPFVASKNKDIDFSDYLYNSRISVRGLRGMIFGIDIVTFLLGDFLVMILMGIPFAFMFADGTIASIVTFVCIAGIFLLYFFVAVPMNFKRIMFIYLLGDDACKVSQSIVVKRRPSTKIEYDPLFDVPVKSEGLDINK